MKRTRVLASGLLLASLALSPAWAQRAPNRATVLQQGAGNAAGIQQTGVSNDAGVLQFGRGNTGIVTQEGTGNAACLVQMGRNLGGTIQQVGESQTFGVLQTRGGLQEIPLALCDTAKSRGDVWAYMSGRGGFKMSVGGTGRSVR